MEKPAAVAACVNQCGKPSWNRQPGEFCSTACRDAPMVQQQAAFGGGPPQPVVSPLQMVQQQAAFAPQQVASPPQLVQQQAALAGGPPQLVVSPPQCVAAGYRQRPIGGEVRLFAYCVSDSGGSSGVTHGEAGLDRVQEAAVRYVCSAGHDAVEVQDEDEPKTVGELEDAMKKDCGLRVKCFDCSATRGIAFLICRGKVNGVRCRATSLNGELALLPQVRRPAAGEVCAISGASPADGRLIEFDACRHAIGLPAFTACVREHVEDPAGARRGRFVQSPVCANFALTCPVGGTPACRDSFVHQIHQYKACDKPTYSAVKSWTLPISRPRRKQNRWGDGLVRPAAGTRCFFPDCYVPQKPVQQAILAFGTSAAEVDEIMQKGIELESLLRTRGVDTVAPHASTIFAYTLESEAQIYCKLNRACRTLGFEEEQNLELYRDYLFHFDRAVSTLRNFVGRVYRAIDTKIDPTAYEAGNVITWQQNSSTSRKQETIHQFLHNDGPQLRGTVFVIKCSTGKDIRHFSAYPDEEEVLLTCNFHARVLRRVEANDEKLALLHTLAAYDISNVDVYELEEFV